MLETITYIGILSALIIIIFMLGVVHGINIREKVLNGED